VSVQVGAVPAAGRATPQTASNQVNLNQYFGKGSAPKPVRDGKRFSLFHHKKAKPVIREVQLSGVSPDAFAAPPAAVVAPEAGPPAVVPGTGVGNVAATAPMVP